MAMSAIAAEDEQRKFRDDSYGGFQGWPTSESESIDDAKTAWGETFFQCTLTVAPIASVNSIAARAAFLAAASGMHIDFSVFQAAAMTFADVLLQGMITPTNPASPYFSYTVPTTPYLPVGGSTTDAPASCAFMGTYTVSWFSTAAVYDFFGTPTALS